MLTWITKVQIHEITSLAISLTKIVCMYLELRKCLYQIIWHKMLRHKIIWSSLSILDTLDMWAQTQQGWLILNSDYIYLITNSYVLDLHKKEHKHKFSIEFFDKGLNLLKVWEQYRDEKKTKTDYGPWICCCSYIFIVNWYSSCAFSDIPILFPYISSALHLNISLQKTHLWLLCLLLFIAIRLHS